MKSIRSMPAEYYADPEYQNPKSRGIARERVSAVWGNDGRMIAESTDKYKEEQEARIQAHMRRVEAEGKKALDPAAEAE